MRTTSRQALLATLAGMSSVGLPATEAKVTLSNAINPRILYGHLPVS